MLSHTTSDQACASDAAKGQVVDDGSPTPSGNIKVLSFHSFTKTWKNTNFD